MGLFPFVEEELDLQEQTTTQPIREYEIDLKNCRLTGRIVEGVDALAIWAYLALKANRYKHVIYSWYYGEEYTKLIGYSYSEEYLQSEVQRYIEECILENENITGISNLVISHVKDRLSISFTLVTKVGSKEVELDV